LLRIDLVSTLADYFVICTGANTRLVRAIADELLAKLDESNIKPLGLEGLTEATWVLLDCGDVVVHIFAPEERKFYRLEQLWSDAQLVLSMQ